MSHNAFGMVWYCVANGMRRFDKEWKGMKGNEREWNGMKGNEMDWKGIKGNERVFVQICRFLLLIN